MLKRAAFVVAGLLLSFFVFAEEGPPTTNISLVSITSDFNVLKNSYKDVTQRDGYDNQPHFASNSLLYWTSFIEEQTDIWQIDLINDKQKALINTPESEYSPTLMPDGEHISVIRVEADGTQRLWSFEISGENPTVIFENIKPVGYHSWLNESEIALFILGDKMTLQLANTNTGKAKLLDSDIGRSLHKVHGENKISYTIHRDNSNEIRLFDLATQQSEKLTDTRGSVQDYVWLSDKSLLMPEGNKIYRFIDNEWQLWAHFEELGEITRLAVSPDGTKLAFVHGTK